MLVLVRASATLLLVAGCGRIGFGASDLDATSSNICASDAPGLVGYWPLDADAVISGQVVDRTAAARAGLVQGSGVPVVVAAQRREGLDFSATDVAYISLPAIPVDVTDGGATTFSMWLRNDNPDVNDAFAFFPDPNPTRYDLWFNKDQVGVPSLCINTGNYDCWGHADADLVGRWVHVVAVIANGEVTEGQLYIDGARIAMTCVFGDCARTRTIASAIGFGSTDEAYPWRGVLDEIRIFDRAVSDDEAAALAACP